MNTKKIIIGLTVMLSAVIATAQTDGKQRGLWVCKTQSGSNVFVSWRMRATDNPWHTTYKLYANNRLVKTLTDRTNTTLSSSYASATFRLEVLDGEGNIIDKQENVKCDANLFHHIKLQYPGDYTMKDGTVVTYTPNDCSAYDMDGDGEQEIIVKWEPSNAGATCTATGPQLIDCYKLDGTRLWRIDLGPNVIAGCRVTFLCYDFDGDGKGELITKTAQGTKDGLGELLSKGSAEGADHAKSSINSSGVITSSGKEWVTCFDGVTGRELYTIDYWPLFSIRSNWADDGKTDGAAYGHRGNWFKGCVAFLDVDGKPTPCAVTVRGIYTYSYAAAYTWDGEQLRVLWKHTSDKKGQGIYGEGAHSLTVGDLDGDGFDEVMVGAAALDHDGTLLWRTGLGHGDATHLGDFDPDNEGLEVFMITEESNAAYDAALLDGKTGSILAGIKQTGGDTGRGLILDCDDKRDGAEFMEMAETNLMTCKAEAIAPWKAGAISSASINYAIYWDGDLLREFHDRSHIDKWSSKNHTWDRTMTLYQFGYGANTINSTKYNCNLQCDLYGDWREEAVYWAKNGNDFYLTIFTTTTESKYKLPWLRDDHTYDLAIAWQNCGYNQPPHLGYSPVEYNKEIAKGEPTGIILVEDVRCQMEDIRDLMGRRVDKPRKGIYIINGKKIVY
jgi:rhamnogalacturonan endolyase